MQNSTNKTKPMGQHLWVKNAKIVTPIGFCAHKGAQMKELMTIDNTSIVIKDGIISFIGKPEDIDFPKEAFSYPIFDADGKCVLPGFVDSHTHFLFGGERAEEFSWRLRGETYMSIMERGGGIAATVNATRKASSEELLERALLLLNRMSAMGVTTVEGKSGYGLDEATEIRQLELMDKLEKMPQRKVSIVTTYLGGHAIPPEFHGDADAYVDFMIQKMLPIVKSRNLAEFCDVFCEKGVFSIEQSRRLLTAARDMGLKLKLHADEIVALGGAGLAAELRATSADHLLHASDEDIQKMGTSGVITTLLPLTAFALKEPYARARYMIDHNCAVALATDLNPGSCFSGSIPLMIALACIYMKMSIEEVITALTLNGAAAINRADTIGSIEVGKKGDLAVLMSDDYNFLPYYIGMNCVSTTIKEGIVYNNL